jgi:hypothetical protein
VAQAGGLLGERALELGLAQHQHAADLLRRDLVPEHPADLVEGQAELLERQDAVELAELAGAVVPVAGLRIGAHRAQQADAVVIAQQPPGDAGDLRELSDPEHGATLVATNGTVRFDVASKSSGFSRFLALARGRRPGCYAGDIHTKGPIL